MLDTPPPRPRLGLRLQLVLALGIIGVLLTVVSAVSLAGLQRIGVISHSVVERQSQLSRLAFEITTQTLLCRRYEKDLFLNLDSPAARADYLERWQSEYARLGQTLAAFQDAAAGDVDPREIAAWRAAYDDYGAAVGRVARAIESGAIATPQEANAELAPFKDSIRTLSDTALATAELKAGDTEAAFGALDEVQAATEWRVAAIGGVALLIALAWCMLYPRQLLRPILALQDAAERMAGGQLSSRAPEDRADELGVLARRFNVMAAVIEERTSDLERQFATAEDARRDAEAAREQLAEQLATVEAQRAVIREMSVPILPLTKHALVMPLVGALDTGRLALFQEQALRMVQEMRARCLLLDVTGVPVVDTQVAQGLLQVIQAAGLLGAEVVVVGIRPEIAQTIVGLGIHMTRVVTRSSLQEGIAYAMTRSAA